MYVFRIAWIRTKTLTTMKIGKTALQNPDNSDVNWMLNDKVWVCAEVGVTPVPGCVDNVE